MLAKTIDANDLQAWAAAHAKWRDYQTQKPQPQSSTIERWYVAFSVNDSTEQARQTLKRGRYEVYYPMVRELRPVPKREMSAKQRNNPFPVMRPTLLPMWPRYFFVRFSLFDGQWRDLFDLARIRGLICDDVGGKPLPAPIDEAVIAGIVSLEVDGAVPSMATVKQIAYEIGEQVRIRTGTFAGHNGVVDGLPDTPLEALDESARLRLLVGMFGAMTPVELSIGDIEKL